MAITTANITATQPERRTPERVGVRVAPGRSFVARASGTSARSVAAESNLWRGIATGAC